MVCRFNALCRHLFLLKTWFEVIPASTGGFIVFSNTNDSKYLYENSVASYHVDFVTGQVWIVDMFGSGWAYEFHFVLDRIDALKRTCFPSCQLHIHILGDASTDRRSRMTSRRMHSIATDPHGSIGCNNCSIKTQTLSFRQPKMF